MKIAFFGTGDFSKNILSKILKYEDIEVSLIVSQPDKIVWRKRILKPTPIKILAQENNIKILQPEKLKWNNLFFNELNNLDFIIVVAYWRIVPKEVLIAPKYGCINIHGSILPLYRWASPIQESIKLWDNKTWLTIMYMSEWMDEWDILSLKEIVIDKTDKTEDVFKKFENIWPELLYNTLQNILNKKITWIPQKNYKATYCSKISKSDGEISFLKLTAKNIYDRFRAYSSWPWIYTYYNDKKLQIDDCEILNTTLYNNIWSIVILDNKKLWIVCQDKNLIILKQIKLEWKKSMDINSFINGNKDFLNYKLN